MISSSPSDNEKASENRYIHTDGGMHNVIANTGDNVNIYANRSSPADIWATFEDQNRRALRNSRPWIEGLTGVVPRPEVADIEKLLHGGESVLIIGSSGTGKSGLGFQLMKRAEERGQPRLALDCRIFHEIRDSPDLQQHLSLGSLSLCRACGEVVKHWRGKNKAFLMVIDQTDSVVGTPAGTEFVEVALDCHGRADIQVVVISRSGEVQEQRLLQPLYREGFRQVQSTELPSSLPYLKQLDIKNPSPEAIEMARNLLNLSLMATIRLQNPAFNFGNITNEVALWNERLEVFLQRNKVQGPQWLAELTRLAECGLKNPGGIFQVSEPPLEAHRNLISEGFIKTRTSTSQICSFSHENLQDFLYARSAVQTGRLPESVVEDLGRFRAQGALIWMDKISKISDAQETTREALLRSLFNV